MRHTISVLVENKFGALTRVAGLFSGRGYNIHSLNVAPTHNPTLSRMTIVTNGDEATIEQIVKQLNKLIDVLKVEDFGADEAHIDRELALIRIQTTPSTRTEAMQVSQIFRAKIVDVQMDTLTMEVTGQESKIEKFIELMKHFTILEITRTGRIAMSRE
ncbi:MAG: acetolactate synthase small subunit [Verrucomicrobia bacterium]|nr:acetolactate synthase small subunit [Verrucomicrobiota bacterium]